MKQISQVSKQLPLQNPECLQSDNILETSVTKTRKLKPIIRQESSINDQVGYQNMITPQIITPKNETITERLQTFGQIEQSNNKHKSLKSLIIYFYQKDFLNQLQKPFKIPNNFTSKHFKLINDLGSSFRGHLGMNESQTSSLVYRYISIIDLRIQMRLRVRTVTSKLKIYLQYIHNRIPLIEPMGNAKFCWDLICIGIRIYLIIVVPVLIAFHDQNFSYYQNSILMIFSLILIFDIIMKGFTITYDKGLPVRERSLLLKKQLNIQSLLELFSFIFTVVICAQQESIIDLNLIGDGWPKFLLMLLYIQNFNILKYIDQSQYSFKLSRIQTSILELIKLITLILLVQHVFSCVWLIFGVQSIGDQRDSWMDKFQNESWNYQYLQAFYFICVTTFTVGYGDIVPKNPSEQLFTIFYMFLCMLLFSYTVNTIGSILTQIKENNDKIKQKITAINEFMHNKQISYQLQFKVREQLYCYFQQETIQQANEQSELIKLLPEELQHSLKSEAAMSLLTKCQFLNQNFSNEFLTDLLENVSFFNFQPGSIIPQKDDFCLYIIEQGQVEVLYKKKVVDSLSRFDYFGLSEFLTQQQNELISYKSTSFTSVLVIQYGYFHQKLMQNDYENQKFYNFQNQYAQYCNICKSTNHLIQKCSTVHYIPNKEVTIKRYLYKTKRKRRVPFERKLKQVIFSNVQNENCTSLTDIYFLEFQHTLQSQIPLERIAQKFKQDNDLFIDQLYPTLEQPQTSDESQSDTEQIEDPINDTIQNSYSRQNSSQQDNKPSQKALKLNVIDKLKQSKFRKQVYSQNLSPPLAAIQAQFKFKMGQKVKSLTMDLEDQVFNQKKDLIHQNYLNELRKKMNNIVLFPKKEQEQIEQLYKKITNMNEIEFSIPCFEQMRNFEIYNRNWNLEAVLKKINSKPKKYRGFKRLKRFLLYPYVFLQKYIEKQIDQQKQMEKFKKRRLTRPKVHRKSRIYPIQ